MGRAFHSFRPENDIDWPTGGKPWHHAASDSFFEMIQRGGSWFQRRWQTGFDGQETNVDEKRVDYVLGSGNHARTYLHLTDKNTLQQLPLGWYAEKGGYWAMNPGYDRPDYAGSVRPIYYECMFCHNGYPRIPDGQHRDVSQMTYLPPLPEGIDCQRCHGPGQRHIDSALARAQPAVVRAAIVNPNRLSSDREIEVCLQCHLETSSEKLPQSIVRFDRTPFSYVPGQPLADFRLAFDRAPGSNNSFEVAQGAYRFRQSQCYLKSAGKLRCTSCHNPHDIPRGDKAASHYNSSLSLVLPFLSGLRFYFPGVPAFGAARAQRELRELSYAAAANRRRGPYRDDGSASRILSPPAGRSANRQSLKRRAWRVSLMRGEFVPYYPAQLPSTDDNELTVAVAQVREQSNLKAGLPLLTTRIEKYHPARPSYYAELAEGYLAAGEPASAVKYFEEASRRDPESSSRLIQWGDALGETGQWALAEEKLRRATELAPDDPRAWGRLGWALWQQNKAGEARTTLEKAIGLGPEIPELHNNLGQVLWGTGDRAAAEKEFRAALRIQPGVAEWRLNLGRALASQGETVEARFQLEQSLRLKPDFAEARVDYARVLADLNRPAEAEKEAGLAVAADPRSAAGHEIWGARLAGKGDLFGARRGDG